LGRNYGIFSQWPQWVCKDGELLLDPTVNGDFGGLSLYQIVNTPPSSSRTDGVTDSSDHSAQPDAPSSTSDNQPTSNNNSWFTTRNMFIAEGIILCLLLGLSGLLLGLAGSLLYGATVGEVLFHMEPQKLLMFCLLLGLAVSRLY